MEEQNSVSELNVKSCAQLFRPPVFTHKAQRKANLMIKPSVHAQAQKERTRCDVCHWLLSPYAGFQKVERSPTRYQSIHLRLRVCVCVCVFFFEGSIQRKDKYHISQHVRHYASLTN